MFSQKTNCWLRHTKKKHVFGRTVTSVMLFCCIDVNAFLANDYQADSVIHLKALELQHFYSFLSKNKTSLLDSWQKNHAVSNLVMVCSKIQTINVHLKIR